MTSKQTFRPIFLGVWAAIGMLAFAGLVRAEEDHPIIKQVKEIVKDVDKPFTLLVILEAKEGKEAELEAAFTPAIRQSRKEKGCIHYELNRDAKKPTRYLMYERWQNAAALQAHLKTTYVTELIGKLGDLTAGAPEFHVGTPAAE